MAAIDQALVSILLNGLTPTGVAGIPGTAIGTPVGTSAMKVRLNSTVSTAAAAGTEITNGTGYTTGGLSLSTQSTASSAGSNVAVPGVSAISWTSSGSNFLAIASFDLTGSAGQRSWWGPFNGQPIAVANGNTFQIGIGGITISLA